MDDIRQALHLPNIVFGCVNTTGGDSDSHIWANNERHKISESIRNKNEINDEDWQRLRTSVASLARETLMGTKMSLWQQLQSNLDSLWPLRGAIAQDRELVAVLRGVSQRLQANAEWSLALPGLVATVASLLPAIATAPPRNPPPPPHPHEARTVAPLARRRAPKAPSTAIVPPDTIAWFVDPLQGDLFDPATVDTSLSLKAKKIKIRDILSSIGTVGTEIILSESAFERPFENMIKAMNIDMTRFGHLDVSGIDAKMAAADEYYEEVEQPRVTVVTPLVAKKGVDLLPLPRTGREGVIYMLKCFHMREMRLAYFNYKQQRIVDFYALVAVTKFQVEKEHFIFSSVGIIHHRPDGTGVAMSLTDWYRESILYGALQCVPFIKTFLIRKHFQSWLKMTIHNRHKRKVRYLERRLPMANVVFGKSMLQILKLLDEVSMITLVPKALEHTHTEITFLKEFSQISEHADGYLQKFYRYIKLVVDETAAESYKYFQFCQAQVNNVYLYSGDCIYKRKLKDQERQNTLRKAMNQVSQLGNFVRMVNYLLDKTIVDITLHNIFLLAELLCSMESDSEKSMHPKKEAIFQTNLVIKTFEEENVLSYNPTVDEIDAMFQGSISGIPQLILRYCFPLNGLLSSEYLSRYNDIVNGSTGYTDRGVRILSGKAESRNQMMDESSISKPELPFIELPTKREDDLRVATPPQVNPNILNKASFVVFGHALPSKFTPMSCSSVFDILDSNPLFKDLMRGFEDLFVESEIQMQALCKDHEWFLEVRHEYSEWSAVDMETEWDGLPPYLFEQRIIKVKNFLLQLSCTERSVTIPSLIFIVSLSDILDDLTSEMEMELDSIFGYVLRRVRTLGTSFIEEVTGVLDVLRLRSTDAETFSRVTVHIVECREHISQHQASVDYVKSLFDVLRVADRTLSPGDREVDDRVASLWESFVFQLQEASDFVSNEKENVVLAIKSQIQVLEEEAKAIDLSLNDNSYSTLAEGCSEILIKINNKLNDMGRIKSETDKLILCYKTLQGEQYDRTIDMDGIVANILFLEGRWRLLQEAKSQIDSWKMTLFSQFEVSIATDMVLGWQKSLSDMRSRMGSENEVIKEIEDVIEEFASFMSLFRKLSSPLLQLEHWQRFFIEIGHDFIDPFETLTVGDLMGLDIRQYAPAIDVLFNDAVLRQKALADFEQSLRFWMTREFQFAVHVTETWFTRQQEKEKELTMFRERSSKKSGAERYYINKRLSEDIERRRLLPITNNSGTEISIIVDLQRLFEDITDSIITLQCRTSTNKVNEDNNRQYVLLLLALEELQRLCDVLQQCQEKWVFLERMFEEEYFVRSYRDSAILFQRVNQEFVTLLRMIQLSPTSLQHTEHGMKFLAIESNPSIEKGLLCRLKGVLATMNDIISSLAKELSNARNVFPRLYFVPDEAVTKSLCCDISKDLRSLIPLVKLCFSSITDLTVSKSKTETLFAVTGRSGEQLRLLKEPPLSSMASQWLKGFEVVLKSSMKFCVSSSLVQHLTECRNDTREGDGTGFFVTERSKSTVFDEIDKIESLASRMPPERQVIAGELVHDILTHYQSWLLRYPLQTILVAEKVIFYKGLKDSLSHSKNNLTEVRTRLLQKEKVFLRLYEEIRSEETIPRVAVEHLILGNRGHISIVDNLMEDDNVSLNSFLYQSLIKYDVDFDQLKMWRSPTVEVCSDVRIEVLGWRFTYDYEYLDVGRASFAHNRDSERCVLNMLNAISNYEVGTIVGGPQPSKESFTEVSYILGRNLFSTCCNRTMDLSLIRRYMMGALASGSLLHLDGFEMLSLGILSQLSRDLWLIRRELQKDTGHRVVPRRIRRLSATSKPLDADEDEVLNVQPRTVPNSYRCGYERQNMLSSISDTRLEKGNTWPGEPHDETDQFYSPTILAQIGLYSHLLDIRYGFGVLATICGKFDIQEIPESMKSQLRIHSLIEMEESLLLKPYLILAGLDQHEDLEGCIVEFMQTVRNQLPDLSLRINNCLPRIISNSCWIKDDCRSELGRFIYDMVVQMFSPDEDLKILLREAVAESFKLTELDLDGSSESSSALVHQLKSQLRVRGLKISKDLVTKMVDLKNTIHNNKVTYVTGDSCSGKTTSIEILSTAVNGLYSSAQRIISGSKKRGAIEVLRTISKERKHQAGTEDIIEVVDQRIHLVSIALSNFSPEESAAVAMDQGKQTLGALLTLLTPLLKSSVSGKFQIWLHVDHILNDSLECLHPLQCVFEDEPCVKIVIELNSSPLLPFLPNPSLSAIIRLECLPDLWKIIMKRGMKGFLTRKLVTYYGCKLLLEVAENMFRCFFDRIDLQLECSQDQGLKVNCVNQTILVMEIMLIEYARYHPTDAEDTLPNIDRKCKGLLSFSFIQGARGTLYSELIGQRLLNLDELENHMMITLREHCDLTNHQDELGLGLFGMMIDFNSLTLRPFRDVKGEKLPSLWSNSDGVAKYLLQLLVKHRKSARVNGHKGRVEGILETIRFQKRLHLNKYLSVKELRKCLHNGDDQYWKVVSNEDPLVKTTQDSNVVLVEMFDDHPGEQRSHRYSFLPFILQYQYCFDGDLFEKVRTDEQVILLANYSSEESNWTNYSKVTRSVAELNIIEPSFLECRDVIYRSFSLWLQKVQKHRHSLSKVVAKHLSDFIVDIGISLRQHHNQSVVNKTYAESQQQYQRLAANQVSWGQLCRVVKALTDVPIDVLQHTIHSLEKTFALEKSEVLKRYKAFAIYVRIIRHSIFELSRTLLDRLGTKVDKEVLDNFMQQSLLKNLSQSMSLDVDDMVLKHFPVAVEKMTDIVLWPCRLIDAESCEHNTDINYQPIVEAHCWQMLDLAQESLCAIGAIRDHLVDNPQLVPLMKNAEFLGNIMRMYKHGSGGTCSRSSLFVRCSSSLVSGRDYGILLKGLLAVTYIRPEGLLDRTLDIVKDAVTQAGRSGHKVLLHIDSSCLVMTEAIYDSLTQILNQDSIIPLMHYLQLSHLLTAVRDLHPELFIPSRSPKEVRLAKAFLGNVQRNLKIFVTCSTEKMLAEENFERLSTFFLERELNYLVLDEYSSELFGDSVASMLGSPTSSSSSCSSLSSRLSSVHRCLAQTFLLSGGHLKLSTSLYNCLHEVFSGAIAEEMNSYGSAVTSVDRAGKEIDDLKAQRTILQDSLRTLNEEVDASGNEARNMRDSYGSALMHCKAQEHKVSELFGPLNEMKEKSQTNFDEVSPTYMAALETIRNLDPDAVEEIKTYARPPQQVRDLIGVIFSLLGYETQWELIKERMVKINLYEELLYLDKDHISDEKYKEVERTLLDPRLQPEYLDSVSKAAASLSRWLMAVYRYSSLNKEINPQLGELLSCQDQINRAQSELGKMRVRADTMRQDLERKISAHKELMSKRKNVSDKLKNVNYKIDSGTNLLSDMSLHYSNWKKRIESLTTEKKNLPNDVLRTVIRSVYLDRLPHSLRGIVFDTFGDKELNVKEEGCRRVLRDQDYVDLLQQNSWTQLYRDHLNTAMELCAVVTCPSVPFSDMGTIVMVHCYNEGCDDVMEVISTVLESDVITKRLGATAAHTRVHYLDCCRHGGSEIDEVLETSMGRGDVLVLKRIHLLDQLSPGLLSLLQRDDDALTVDPRFRLLLINGDGFSGDSGSCCGLLHSDRVLHFDFSLGRADFEGCLEETVIRCCELELQQSLRNCQSQDFDLDRRCIAKQEHLVEVLSSFRGASLLAVKGLHSTLLQVDSKLLAICDSRDGLQEKRNSLLSRTEKYEPVVANVSLLLSHLETFPSHSGTSRSIVSLGHVLELVQATCASNLRTATVAPGSAPEITEAFLQVLESSITAALVALCHVRMASRDTWRCLLAFSVDKMLADREDLDRWTQAEATFIRRALLCRERGALLDGVEPGSMDLGILSPHHPWPNELLALSLVLETNIVVLAGLTEHLLTGALLWQEYFQFPFSGCTPVPGFDVSHQPGLLLKAVIWRALNPDKLHEVQCALMADVFGEDPLRTLLAGSHRLQAMVSLSAPSRPILVLSGAHVRTVCGGLIGSQSEGIQRQGSPCALEVIAGVHEAVRAGPNIRVVDCCSPMEMAHLLSATDDPHQPRIARLLADGTWLVLLNLHLASVPSRLLTAVLRGLLSLHPHPESRVFITLDSDGFPRFTESLLLSEGCSIYHCGCEADLDSGADQLPTVPSAPSLCLVDQRTAEGLESALTGMLDLLLRAARTSGSSRRGARAMLATLLPLASVAKRASSTTRCGNRRLSWRDVGALWRQALISNDVVPPEWLQAFGGRFSGGVADWLAVVQTRVRECCGTGTP